MNFARFRLWPAVLGLLIFSLAGTGAALAAGKISFLVIDIDSYLAHQAMKGLELSPDLQARAFTLADLEEEPDAAGFVADSAVVLVDVMDEKLSNYLLDKQLMAGKTVFALRGSRDDQSLAQKGFIFNEELSDYFSNLTEANLRNMIRRAVSLTLDSGLTYEPVHLLPEIGLYHPEAPDFFTTHDEYRRWYEARPSFDPDKPWLGMMFFTTSMIAGQKDAGREIIKTLESTGFNVLPAFGRDLAVLESFFLTVDRKSRVDAILSFSLKFHLAFNDELKQALIDLDVPIFNAVSLSSQTIDAWRDDDRGIAALDVIWTIATPEVSGLIEPTPLIGKVEDRDSQSGARIYRYESIPGMAEHVALRLLNWVKLRRKANDDKKVAIIYYNHSEGKQNIGASYLNVFASLEEILTRMKAAGYQIPDGLKLDDDQIQLMALEGGRNVGNWAPGELDKLAASGQVIQLPIEEYKKWFTELPDDFQKKIVDQWGTPEASDIMILNGRIIIPLVRFGNIILMPEPARSFTADPHKLAHDHSLYPHHQYIAAYLWLKHSFGADAMVHLGTHATYEWLPGKQTGLSLSCPPEIMVTDIPNIYPYIVDDVGEGLQAKRRGRGVIIDHLIPPLTTAGGHNEYEELGSMIERFEQAESFEAKTTGSYFDQIRELAVKLGLDKDLDLDFQSEEDIHELAEYLAHLEHEDIPFGLHTFGRSPADDSIKTTAESMLRQNKDLKSAEVTANLEKSGPSEMAAYLAALEGRYIQAAEGNDPVRNPSAIPTGKNFYGLSPNRMPTRAAWELGQKAADEIVAKYIEEHQTYPDKVAVVLWAVESLRNEGLNESTVLALIGVEPVWSPGGQITGTRPIPAKRLKRPRIDVAINASGLYRDLFPDKILFLDAAIRQAAAQDDLENFISRNDQRIKNSLIKSGLSEEDAGRFSRARIFSEKPGSYGNRVSEMTTASGLWENDSEIVAAYLKHSGFAYTGDLWGVEAQTALEENLRDAKVAWHSISSRVYGLMDTDDMFMYLGGLSMAIRDLSGQAPQTLVADQRTVGQVSMENLNMALGREMRARYLNPKWIEGMKSEKYAGAREMSNYVEYLWGWQVTTPEALSEKAWEQTYDVYVEDKYDLGLKEFMEENNPWAYQSLTARMLESIRKDYWAADESVKVKLSVEYAMNVISKGVACCDHTCNNPQLNQMVMNIISLPGVMSPELAAEFKLAVETANQKPLEAMVENRLDLLKNMGSISRAEAAATEPETAATESVKGLKMEKVDNMDEKTSISSSGVEWFASLFVIALSGLFFLGLRRRR
ncbi:cobaltochelatase subunit CobN [Deltaproteobacteria bacterium OttesenSCG-928-M10]|nr:cobaltochelatase subunit CobN [Deltaproteobacteria bacterium OttesenSCG-928-M10]